MFWNRHGNIKALVALVSSGDRSEFEWLFRTLLLKKFETKMTMVGEDDELGQGNESAEPNREVAPAQGDHKRG